MKNIIRRFKSISFKRLAKYVLIEVLVLSIIVGFALIYEVDEMTKDFRIQGQEIRAEISEASQETDVNYIFALEGVSEDNIKYCDELLSAYLPENVRDYFFKANDTIIVIESGNVLEFNSDYGQTYSVIGQTKGYGGSPIVRVAENRLAGSLIHELGHADSDINSPSRLNLQSHSYDFMLCFTSEVENIAGVDENIVMDHISSDAEEYFAEAFMFYFMKGDKLKEYCPKTYDYIDNIVWSMM